MKTVIMAGGKGTRISSLASDIPKPMIKIKGKPVLEYEIECLKEQGFTDIIITVSHLADIIIDYFGNGSKISPITNKPFGVNIEYYVEEKPLGNAGALFKIKDKLKEDFLLLNADSIFNINFNRFIQYHKQKGGLATLFTHPNNHPYDSGLIIAKDDNSVEKWLTKEEERPKFYKNRVNAGIHILSPKILKKNVNSEIVDLDRQILKPLANTGKLFIYDSPEYVKDMGTPERYLNVCKDFDKGKVERRNLCNKQKAIFLDRDGTINKKIDFLKNIDDFELIPGVADAIKKINESDYLAIVITNQPVIARGDITFKELTQIHNKMETLLGNEGAYIDDIFFCPHHPDIGFDGEVKELKIKCECRKPNPGMIFKAKEKYNIDLENSWMIGDSEIDILTGKNAGCKTALVENKESFNEDEKAKNLKQAIDKIINQY